MLKFKKMKISELEEFYITFFFNFHTYIPLLTNDVVDHEKDDFYNQLQDTVSSCNSHDVIAVMGDINAKEGNNNTNREEVMGKFGIGVMNDNGQRLCDFGSANGLVITATIFPHKEIHKLTWWPPDGTTVNQIDHVLVNERMRTPILDTRVMIGADVYSNHYLVRTRISLKLATIEGKKIAREWFDVCQLQSEEIRRYNIGWGTGLKLQETKRILRKSTI